MIAGGDDGHVVNTASMAGLLSAPFMGPYNASKFAVVTISEVLHHELAMTGAKVKVSVLCPGFVATQIGESDRNRPDELRDAFQLDPAMEQFRGVVMQMLASGLPPAEVAAMVLDAVRNDRFYILTHPELKEPVRARMEAILDGEAPAFGTFV
ncbi:MAG: SDR family NAD(P)-dependent oxidoreductase [Actinobacteria bacterium]|nr:MAG: SDR family NAD(P)-dependent oxidoreductase [Actinomycetota bacterium]